MSRVFIVEQPRRAFDLDPLNEFGVLVRLFERDESRSSIFHVDDYIRDVQMKAEEKGFDPDEDYFAFVGQTINVTNALLALLTKYGQMNALLFTAIERRYVPCHYTLGEYV